MVNIFLCQPVLSFVREKKFGFRILCQPVLSFLREKFGFRILCQPVLSFLREKFGFRKFSNLSRLVQYTCVENVLYTQYNKYADCERRPVLDRSFKDMPVH